MTMSGIPCDQDGYRWLARCKAENARLNALPDTVNPQQMLWGINQGGTYADLRVETHEAASQSWTCRATPSAALPSGRRTQDDVRHHRGRRAAYAEGQDALSHGRRDAVEHHRGRGPGRRLLRLRDACAERAPRASSLPGAGRSTCETPSTQADDAPARPGLRLPRLPPLYPRHICIICSRPRRCWPCALRSCTISISTTN